MQSTDKAADTGFKNFILSIQCLPKGRAVGGSVEVKNSARLDR